MAPFDVAIIGGGVHGASAAFHLATRGATVALFERGDAAGGPSGRSSAVCRAYYTDPFLARVARESLDLLADFPARVDGHDADFHHTGALFLHGPDDVDHVRTVAAGLNAIGTRVDVLDPGDLATRFPRLDLDGVACGAYERDAGFADPVSTTVGLLQAARSRGVEVRLHTPVQQLRPAAGEGAELLLADGASVRAQRLLLAAGPWTAPLAAQLGVELPLTVERHVVGIYAWGDAEPLEHAIADVPLSYYGRPEIGDRFLLGHLDPVPGGVDPDRFDERLHDDESEELLTKVVARVPALEQVQPRGGWASLYDVSPDWQPVIGRIGEGLFVDAGTSGHGFKLAPALGRHVADLILGEPDPDLQRFSPDRFRAGTTVAGGYGDARLLG